MHRDVIQFLIKFEFEQNFSIQQVWNLRFFTQIRAADLDFDTLLIFASMVELFYRICVPLIGKPRRREFVCSSIFFKLPKDTSFLMTRTK